MALQKPILGVEKRPEAQKLPVNPIQEYYHPTKHGPQPASLAQVMRSMSGAPAPAPVRLRLRLGSMGGQVVCCPAITATFRAKCPIGDPPQAMRLRLSERFPGFVLQLRWVQLGDPPEQR